MMIKRSFPIVAVLSVVVALALLLASCSGGRQKPNVVLIVVDSLRADGLGCYGDKPSASPQTDRLAAEGLRFERVIAQSPWNLPAISSLVTSTYPWKNGRGVADPKAGEITTAAEVFGKAGFRTAAFTEVAWPLLQRGFETFENTAGSDVFGDPNANSASKTFSAALDWIRKDDKRPFFVFIHTYEAHSFFLGKPKHHAFAKRELPAYAGRFAGWGVRDLTKPAGPQVIEALLGANADDLAYVRALYRGAVSELDTEVGRLAEALTQAGLDQRTIVVLTSSNGEGFRPDLKRVHHGGRLHDDLLHVPLIVRWPGHLAPGVSNALVEELDVAPTLLDLSGLSAEKLFAGRTLISADTGFLSRFRGPRFALKKLSAQPAVAEESTFRTLPSGQRDNATTQQLVLYSDWVTLLDAGDHVELYDLKVDPRQEKDLTAQHPDVAASLRDQLKRYASEASRGVQGPDAAKLEQLRSLGYVQ